MLLHKIILRNQDEFETAIAEWAQKTRITHEVFDGKISLLDLVSSVVVFHADHNISKENNELRDLLKKSNKPVHQVDINATLRASVSSLKFWLENNKPANVLFVGDDSLTKNDRLEDYLKTFAESLKN